MLPLTIEKMTQEDVDRVWAIDQASFSMSWTRGMFESEMKHTDIVHYLVGRYLGQIVAFAGFWKIGFEAHIMNLAVDPSFRRQKSGERVLRALLEEARQLGCQRATLEVRVSNEAAQNLYKKFGFDIVAIRQKYYTDTQEDALVLWINGLDTACFPQ